MFSALFNPSSIAIVGAARDQSKIGAQILKNLLKQGFKGQLYPVNNKEPTLIQGLTSYTSLAAIPDTVDLVVVAIPASFVETIIDEAIIKKVQAVVIISAGFKELDSAGAQTEARIAQKCAAANITLLGPNCLGLIHNPSYLNASFAHHAPQPGNITFISQSGAFGTAAIDWADTHHLGFDTFVSLGNKAGLNENDLLLNYLHPGTKLPAVIVLYLEDFANGHLFMHHAHELTKSIPVVLLKPGKSEHAKSAMQSHTGSLATDDSIITAACAKAGIIRADTSEELFHLMHTFSQSKRIKGNRIAIITNAGGPGILATDHLAAHGLTLAHISPAHQKDLSDVLPRAANIHDPVDVLGDAKADRYFHALKVVVSEAEVDGILVILTPQTTTEIEKTAQVIAQIQSITDKPILASFLGGSLVQEGINYLTQKHIVAFHYPEQAISTFGQMFRYYTNATRNQLTPIPLPLGLAPSFTQPSAQLQQLPYAQSVQLIRETGLLSVPSQTVTELDQVHQFIQAHPVPVVLKYLAPKLLHKTELHAVHTHLETIEEITEAFLQLQKLKSSRNDPQASILIQQQVSGLELFLGMKRDPQFGPVILFGTGGIYTEIFQDIATGIAPLTRNEALNMIKSTKIGQILQGARGRDPYDLHNLAVILCQLGALALTNPHLHSLDLNPLILTSEDQLYAVDPKILAN